MFDIGFGELLLILVVALIVFGPGRLPEIGAALGRALREFRQASSDLTRELLRPEEREAPPGQDGAKENRQGGAPR